MKNILNHNGTSQLLLANVDDGTNSIVINGEELDPTYWVGENSYVVLIDGTPIGIRQISSNSGNIMMRKVSGHVNEYQLVRQSDALCYSHVGQIIESTTLATLEDVQAIYGSDTTWIQHTGYILRGASSGVTADSAAKDGGADSVTYTPSGTNSGGSVGNTTLGLNNMPSDVAMGSESTGGNGAGAIINTTTNWRIIPLRDTGKTVGQAHGHSFTQPTFNGTQANINTLPKYKNVYIWERTA